MALKRRLMGVLVIKGGLTVQSFGFARHLPVGDPAIAVEHLDRWGIDEIVLLDTEATTEGRRPRFETVARCAARCRVPLAVGGGIRDLRDMELLVRSGADKVVLNTALLECPGLLTEGARRFGRQCMVASVDVREPAGGSRDYEAYLRGGKHPAGYSARDLARHAQLEGAGEILLTGIDRDGARTGYDLDLIAHVRPEVEVPLIACGGAGHPRHFAEALAAGADAVAAANLFHHTEQSAVTFKRYLNDERPVMRLDTHATYAGAAFDAAGRVTKRDDDYLEALRFEYTPEERI